MNQFYKHFIFFSTLVFTCTTLQLNITIAFTVYFHVDKSANIYRSSQMPNIGLYKNV